MLETKFSDKWAITQLGMFRGTPYVNDVKINNIGSIDKLIISKGLHETANLMHGFWGAVIIKEPSLIYIFADIMRSYPIYYAIEGEYLYISDDVYWLREKCKNLALDHIALDEFEMVGYVTGPDTIYYEIKQLQAGEIITLQYDSQRHVWQCKSCFYYRYVLQEEYSATFDELLQMLEEKLNLIFHRLITYADGRPIVVPLSGGYDSRLITLMLKKLRYDNVIAFSYGVYGNKNSYLSKQVAEELSIPWHFVEYTNDKWKTWYLSNEMREYERYAGGFSTLPHFQDWPAVMSLKRQHLVPDNSIFVPGHCIEMGFRTTRYPEVYSKFATFEDALNAIISLHYYLNGGLSDKKDMAKYKIRIKSRMGDFSQYISPASLFDAFEQQERQVKYINNSVRVYEFWGFDWWTPLWEREYQDFWASVPMFAKRASKLYIANIKNLCSLFGVFSSHGEKRDDDKNDVASCLKRYIKMLMPAHLYSKLREKRKNTDINFHSHPLAFYGCFSDSELREHVEHGRSHFLSMLVYEYLACVLNKK